MRRMVQQPRRNGSGHVPAVTPRCVERPTRVSFGSDHGFGLPLEGLTGFQHRMHDDCELAGNCDGRSLETDPFAQLHPPGSQGAPGAGSGQNHGRRLIEQASQMGIAAARHMPVVIDLAGLETPRDPFLARSPIWSGRTTPLSPLSMPIQHFCLVGFHERASIQITPFFP